MSDIFQKIIIKFCGNDNRSRKAFQNIVISFVIKGVSILTSFLLVPITLGYLKPVEYGVWMTLSSILVWLNYFDIGLGNGLRNKLAEAIAKNNLELGRSYVSTTIFLLSIIITIIIGIILVVNIFIDWHQILNIDSDCLPNLNSIISILFVLCGVQFVVRVVGTVYVAHQVPVANDLLNCLGQILSLIYIYILSKVTNGDFEKVVIGFTLAPILVYCLAVPYTFWFKYRYLKPSLKYIELKYVPQLGGLGYKFFLIQIFCLILFSSSNIIISHNFGSVAVSEYNIAYKYLNISLMIFTIILSPYWTAVTDAYHRKDISWIINTYKMLNRIWYGFLLLIIFQIVVSKFVFKIWIKNEVEITYPLLNTIAIFLVILMRSNLLATFFNGLNNLGIQLFIAFGEGVLYVVSLFLLIPVYGMIAVPISLGISMFFGTIVYQYHFHKLIKSL